MNSKHTTPSYRKQHSFSNWMFIFLLILVFMLPKLTLASHIAGGKFEYKYLTNGTDAFGNPAYKYEVKYYHYQPCSSPSIPPMFNTDPTNLSLQTLRGMILVTPNNQCILEKADHSVSIDLSTRLYYSASSILPENCACENGALAGDKEYVFSGNVDVPVPLTQDEDWNFILKNNARLSCNSVLPGSSYQSFYVNAYLRVPVSNAAIPNTSVKLMNSIMLFPLKNQSFTYNFGAYDKDGDFLVYKLVPPKRTVPPNSMLGVNPINYNVGYSFNNPLGPPLTNGSFAIDRYTGAISGIANVFETVMIAIEISERDATDTTIVKGTVTADFLLTVFNGNNINPELSGINGVPGQYSISIVKDVSHCFHIDGNDANSTDLVTISSADVGTALPASTFTVSNNGTGSPGVDVCWIPNTVGTYCFTIKAEDNACSNPNVSPQSYNGITVKSYCVTVIDNPCCQLPDVTLTLANAANPISILIQPEQTITEQMTFCSGAILHFVDSVTTCEEVGSFEGVRWDVNDTATQNGYSATYTFNDPGVFNINLHIGPDTNCIITYFIKIIDCDHPCEDCIPSFSPQTAKDYLLSAWAKQVTTSYSVVNYESPKISLVATVVNGTTTFPVIGEFNTTGEIIDGWQRIVGKFTVPEYTTYLKINLESQPDANSGAPVTSFFDDIRIHPLNANMKSYVYDPKTMKLYAELDENNYATFYEYDEEGKLIRLKKETEKGIMTIQENRNNTSKR